MTDRTISPLRQRMSQIHDDSPLAVFTASGAQAFA